MKTTTFAQDAEFLSSQTEVVVLDACSPALVAVTPQFQGRVMTSTPTAGDGPSLGWVNRDFVRSGGRGTAFDNYGGEDRFWLGPEGGQFALWFRPGEPFDTAHWRTPEGFNTGTFAVTSRGRGSLALAARFDVTNRAGTVFPAAVKRVIDALTRDRVAEHLGVTVPRGVACVAFQSTNVLANVGDAPWTRDGGLLSVWTLGQFTPLPRGLVIVPFLVGDEARLGPLPHAGYFGKVPPDRFWIEGAHAFFRCDGRFRSKLGVSPRRAVRVLGSYDPDAAMLTAVQFNLPSGAAGLPYVNSLWEQQKHPFAGDAINSYNDGEERPGGGQLGPFYEIETSSPAAELGPNESLTHVHRTFHFTGPFDKLSALAGKVLGVDLSRLRFPEQ